METIAMKKKNNDYVIGIPTTDGYDKSRYKWDPVQKKVMYIKKSINTTNKKDAATPENTNKNKRTINLKNGWGKIKFSEPEGRKLIQWIGPDGFKELGYYYDQYEGDRTEESALKEIKRQIKETQQEFRSYNSYRRWKDNWDEEQNL